MDGECAGLIPAGPSYSDVALANQVCPLASAQPGNARVDGSAYLRASYGYEFSNTARNAGILLGFWIFFVVTHVIASEYQTDPGETGGVMVFHQGKQQKRQPPLSEALNESSKNADSHSAKTNSNEVKAVEPKKEESLSTFTWHHVSYDVQVKGGSRRLLNDVSGYVAPGKMTALMGESGAGKTTLLNVLAQRASTGVIHGQFLVDGQPIDNHFQAGTGYCQQQDLHLETQTVREAIRFSAELRQPREVPREEKWAYADEVIGLLEMESFAEAIVGNVGEGLNLEQRKRLTIAVELAAKPALLLFLDEPTSGLDAMAAWSIVGFLRKLADAGQAILCTIHQPSGELFNQFDRLLLLQKGGKTVFFGDIGHNSKDLIAYFQERSGSECPSDKNPAEYILETIGGATPSSASTDWHSAFLNSPLNAEIERSLARHVLPEKEGRHQAKSKEGGNEFAASFLLQLQLTMTRALTHYWRSPSYVMSKVLLNIVAGLFIGSSFWGQGSNITTSSLQNKVFAIFMALIVGT